MKKNTSKRTPARLILILIFVFSGLTACTERWEEMNTDPNRLTDLPDEYLFTSAVRGAFNDAMGDIQVNFGGQYAHIYISNNWVREIDKYNGYGTQDYPEMVFSGVYNSSIRNLVEVLRTHF